MDVGNRRSSRNGVVSGSVWENRMRLDEVKGGIKVFCNTSEEDNDDNMCSFPTTVTENNNNQVDEKLKMGPTPNVRIVGKRKTWKAHEGNPLQIARKRSGMKTKCGNVRSKSQLDSRILKKSNLEEKFGMCEEKFMTSNVKSEPNHGNEDDDEWDEALEEDIDVKAIRMPQEKPKKIVFVEKKLDHSNKRSVPINKLPPSTFKIHPTSTYSDECQFRHHSKLQTLVDLVMWRDVPKSALVFGFLIISSSFTQHLDISFISVLSYLGLLYLAAIFLFRSLIPRGTIDIGECIVGEEEAVRVLKLLLPCINEFLLKIINGDPATTMKMAFVLFLLARYGSFITIWKLGFFGFSSYQKFALIILHI